MFTNTVSNTEPTPEKKEKKNTILTSSKYKSVLPNGEKYTEESSFQTIDQLLENENIQNKKDAWNKIDKTVKIQKLHEFAERYGKEHSLPVKDIKSLKLFFNECMNNMKLQKTKDIYSHKPFIKKYNKIGIIKPRRIINIISKNKKIDEVTLYFEFGFRERDPYDNNAIKDIKESIQYWNKFLN
jgi:hypothetical protein